MTKIPPAGGDDIGKLIAGANSLSGRGGASTAMTGNGYAYVVDVNAKGMSTYWIKWMGWAKIWMAVRSYGGDGTLNIAKELYYGTPTTEKEDDNLNSDSQGLSVLDGKVTVHDITAGLLTGVVVGDMINLECVRSNGPNCYWYWYIFE